MEPADLHGVVSCVRLADLRALEDGARAIGAVVLHVDAGGAASEAELLAAIVASLALGDPAANWNWDSVADLLWQRLTGAEDALLVLAGVDGLLPAQLQALLDAAGALRDLARTLAPARCWCVFAGTGPGFLPVM